MSMTLALFTSLAIIGLIGLAILRDLRTSRSAAAPCSSSAPRPGRRS